MGSGSVRYCKHTILKSFCNTAVKRLYYNNTELMNGLLQTVDLRLAIKVADSALRVGLRFIPAQCSSTYIRTTVLQTDICLCTEKVASMAAWVHLDVPQGTGVLVTPSPAPLGGDTFTSAAWW